jgi:hypothetical protein
VRHERRRKALRFSALRHLHPRPSPGTATFITQNEILAELPARFAALRLHRMQEDHMRYALLWLIGIPIPVLIVLYLLFH